MSIGDIFFTTEKKKAYLSKDGYWTSSIPLFTANLSKTHKMKIESISPTLSLQFVKFSVSKVVSMLILLLKLYSSFWRVRVAVPFNFI